MKRGFGSPNYDPEKARQARRKGAQALRDSGKAHRWTQEEAINAGVKGGERRAQLLHEADEQQAA